MNARKRFFKVEEIGTSKLEPSILLKGRKKPIFGEEQELVRRIFDIPEEDLARIISLTEGVISGEAEFIRNVFRLAGNGIKAMGIARIGQNSYGYHITSYLKFLKNGSFSGVLPQVALTHFLACRGIGHGGDIYCDESLDPCSETTCNYLIRKKSVKFKRIEDIRFDDRKPEVHVNENEYERLDFKRVLMNFIVPDSIIYGRGQKEVGFTFPMSKVTFEKAMKDHGLPIVAPSDPYNPLWLADSMTIINYIIEGAKIEVDSIYVDGSLKNYRSMNFLRYDPRSAKIILKKDGKKIVVPANWEQAISLSYLHSKDIWFRDPTKSYVA